MSTLEGMINKTAVIVEKRFGERGEIHPYFYTELNTGRRWLFDPSKTLEQFPFNEGVKDAFAMGMALIFASKKVDRYVMASEAWVVGDNLTDEERKELQEWIASGRGASTHPKRYEVIHYQAEDVNGGYLSARQGIIRPAGERAYLDELEFQRDEMQVSGRFTGFLALRKKLLLKQQQGDI